MKKLILIMMMLCALNANGDVKSNNNEFKKVQQCEVLSDQVLLKNNPGQYFFRVGLLCNYENINNQASFDETIKILEKSASYKYVPAYVLIGYLYENKYEGGSQLYNAKGTKEDLTKAINNLKTAASMGSVVAQNKLGELYLDEINISKEHTVRKDVSNQNSLIPDVNKAIYWLTLAAENGHPAAQGTLSDLYRQGIGVVQNHVLAYVWQNISIVSQSKFNKRITSDEIGKTLLKSHLEVRDEIYNLLTQEQKTEAYKVSETYKKYVKQPSDIDSISTNGVSYISAVNIQKLLGIK